MALFWPQAQAAATSDEVTAEAGGTAESAAATVTGLRSALVEEQIDLIEALAGTEVTERRAAPRAGAADFLARLREDLRRAVLDQRMISGDVDLALRRATMRYLEERIATYEAAYGRHDGVFTTRWNVLSEADLDRLETRLEDRLRGLLTETAGIPDTQLKLRERGQIHEIRADVEAIRFERATRIDGPPRLVSIAVEPTAPDPRASLAAIERIEAVEAERAAERALFVEVERRIDWNGSDPALLHLREKMRTGPYYRKYLAAIVRDGSVWRSGWPPGRGPPPDRPRIAGADPEPHPRGGGGARAAVVDVREGVAREIEAIVTRDPLIRAEAAARWQVGTSWLGDLIGVREGGWQAALATLSDAELRDHLATLEGWKKTILRASVTDAMPEWRRDVDRRLVDERLVMLESEISIRGPPLPGPDAGPRGPKATQRAAERAYEAGTVQSYAEHATVTMEQRRLVELEKRLVTAAEADRVAIREALRIQAERALTAETQSIARAYASAVEAERGAYVNGRGRDGVLSAQRHRAARLALRQAGDGLRTRVGRLVASGTVPAARAAALDAALPRALPTGASVQRRSSVARQAAIARGGVRSAPQPALTLASRRIRLADAPEHLRFDWKFTRSGPNSAEAFRRRPNLAPGGVIVDLFLPAELTARLDGVRYDPDAERFELRLDGKWHGVEPRVAPETARAALGFVLDGRVAAIDIDRPDLAVRAWMVREKIILIHWPMTEPEKQRMLKIRRLLRIVRSNPAIADTEMARSLIAADELIFSALMLEPVLLASRSVFRGIDTLDLHTRLKRDRRRLAIRARDYKSILTVDGLEVATRGDAIVLRPRFDYAVYALPDKLPDVSAWFALHDAALRAASPELRRLEEFAVAVAVIRSAVRRDLADGLGRLAVVHEPGRPSPSLLCRSEIETECDEASFRRLVALDQTDGRIE